MKLTGLISLVLSGLLLTGCIYVNETDEGRRDNRLRSQTEPTIGQELLDLDRARASGAITASEYERAKQAILDDIN